MRFVVLGAGAIGGVVGGRLAQHGHDVVLIARGAHYEAIRDNGLRIESPDEVTALRIPVVDRPSAISWSSDDVLLLATKTQDTEAALDALTAVAPRTLSILCAQNGVSNERMTMQRVANVYGVFVWCPADYLTPGNVRVWCGPKSGILHVGRYPSGSNAVAEAVAAAFRDATFYAEAKTDIMRWKYRKLLSNLGNAVDALCGSAARGSGIAQRARREGVACLAAAGIPFIADEEEDAARLEREVHPRPIGGAERRGGSSWQSLERRLGTIETDYLNGEIVRLGRQYGVPTPVNALLQYLSQRVARERRPPGSVRPEKILSAIDNEARKTKSE
jgi:2-dehydropantoate 2-reductase